MSSQMSQSLGKPQNRPIRTRSTTAPNASSPEPVYGRASLSNLNRSGLPDQMRPPLRSSTSSKSPASLSLHSASGSVSTVSTYGSEKRSTRSRSHTDSSGCNTSITRPSFESFSTTGRKSTSSMWSQYPSMPTPGAQYHHWNRPDTAPPSPDLSSTFTPPFAIPQSDSRSDICPSPVSVATKSETVSGWKAMARKASGKFRRSTSTHNVAMDIDFTPASAAPQSEMSRSTSSSLFNPTSSPKAPRSRSKTVSAPSSDAETDGSTGGGHGLLGGFLSRKKSNNSLRSEKAERNKAWSQLPAMPALSSSPSTASMPASPYQASPGRPLRNKSSKLSIGTGKGKQRLDEVLVSPFDVQFLSAAGSTPLKTTAPFSAEPEDMTRPCTPPIYHRSASHDSSSTTKVTPSERHASLRAPIPRSLSGNSTSSPSPRSPSSSNVLSPSSTTTSLTSSSSQAWDDDDQPPVPPLPMQHQSKMRFPSSFGFVQRPEEEEDGLGSTASAASIPLPLLARLEKKEKKVLDFDALLNEETTVRIKVGHGGEMEKEYI